MKFNEALQIFGFTTKNIPSLKLIRKKYLNLSRKCHPDKGGDPAKFKELQEAYHILTHDDESDSEPVNQRTQKDAYFEGIFGGFNDIFSKFQNNLPKKPAIKKTKLKVKELFTGTTRDMFVQSSNPCNHCHGTGTGSKVKCSDCKGVGMKYTHIKIAMGTQSTETTCKTCKGRGGIGEGSEIPCKYCRGHRIIVKRVKKSIRIPKGIPNDTKIKVDEGDSPTVLHVKYPSSFDTDWGNWRLTNDRILTTSCDISLETALLGGDISVIHPGTNETINVSIPSGIQPGEHIVLKDKGLPACPEAKLPPSNAHILLNVKLPIIPQKHHENTRRFFSIFK
jgi:DnaJ-class molecular chaperone